MFPAMKPPVRLHAVIAACLLSGCEIVPPPPGDFDPPPGGGAEPSGAELAYRDGMIQGDSDRARGRSFHPERNIAAVPPALRGEYRDGYRDGYSGAGGAAGGAAAGRAQEDGYRRGVSDAHAGRRPDWRRYAGVYPDRFMAESFRTGYEEGYEAGSRGSERNPPAVTGSRDAYLRGYEAGVGDYRLGRRASHQAHSGYSRATEAAFRDGYHDGYSGRPRRF